MALAGGRRRFRHRVSNRIRSEVDNQMSSPTPPQPEGLDFAALSAATMCPENNLAQHWPNIEICLIALGIYSAATCIAAMATVAVETNYTFLPIKELGGISYLSSKPYYPYYGRGFIQLTWEKNYKHYGDLLGINMVENPDLALEPNAAASILASFFKEHGVDIAANQCNWVKVRTIVNGGTNGLKEFHAIVGKLCRMWDTPDAAK
jgi:hypothetical protein